MLGTPAPPGPRRSGELGAADPQRRLRRVPRAQPRRRPWPRLRPRRPAPAAAGPAADRDVGDPRSAPRSRRLLDDAPIIESHGRMYPVKTTLSRPRSGAAARGSGGAARCSGRWPRRAAACWSSCPARARSCASPSGCAERATGPAVEIAPLYGALDPATQDRAIAPAAGRPAQGGAGDLDRPDQPDHRRRAGGDRQRHWPACRASTPPSGLTRLETVRVSRRRRRPAAGPGGAHPEPGVCYRLWDEPETRSLAPFDAPEILEADLARVALDLAAGARDPATLAFLDPPPAAAMAEARRCCGGWGRSTRAGGSPRTAGAMAAHRPAAAAGAHGAARQGVGHGRARLLHRRGIVGSATWPGRCRAQAIPISACGSNGSTRRRPVCRRG